MKHKESDGYPCSASIQHGRKECLTLWPSSGIGVATRKDAGTIVQVPVIPGQQTTAESDRHERAHRPQKTALTHVTSKIV